MKTEHGLQGYIIVLKSINHLYKKFALLSFNIANFSITKVLKIVDSLTSFFSIDNIARAFGLSSHIVFLKSFHSFQH